MPDLMPVYDELRRRFGVHEDVFEVTDDGLFDELADLTADWRELYASQGLLRR